MVKLVHSYHRVVQWTLAYPAAMLAHCDQEDLLIQRSGGGAHIRMIAKCTRMQWLGGMPLRKVCKNKMCGEMAEYVHHHASILYCY